MVILCDAVFVRSALIVAHDHWFGADAIGGAVDDAEPGLGVDQRPILHDGYHGTLVPMSLDEEDLPKAFLLRPPPTGDLSGLLTTSAPPAPRAPVSPDSSPDRDPGIRSIVLRL